ncbi:MAG: helix-turn-helix domain-containing protein [Rhabdochlamydiaceae bacterium]
MFSVIIHQKEICPQEDSAMARITRAAPHVEIGEVKTRMKSDSRAWCRQRWVIIYNALVDPRDAKEIAKHVGVSVHTVYQVIFTYNRLGVASIETPGKGGRHHAYLSVEEERDFLLPFFERAEKGELTTALRIKQAFEERVGHEVNERTVGRLLERHEWRKLVPHPFHPQMEEEKQTQFKQDFKKLVEDAIQTKKSNRSATGAGDGAR